jgi:hypothetical protein
LTIHPNPLADKSASQLYAQGSLPATIYGSFRRWSAKQFCYAMQQIDYAYRFAAGALAIPLKVIQQLSPVLNQGSRGITLALKSFDEDKRLHRRPIVDRIPGYSIQASEF